MLIHKQVNLMLFIPSIVLTLNQSINHIHQKCTKQNYKKLYNQFYRLQGTLKDEQNFCKITHLLAFPSDILNTQAHSKNTPSIPTNTRYWTSIQHCLAQYTHTRAVRKVSVHFEYLKNWSCGLDVTWQPDRGNLTAHP